MVALGIKVAFRLHGLESDNPIWLFCAPARFVSGTPFDLSLTGSIPGFMDEMDSCFILDTWDLHSTLQIAIPPT